MVTRSNAPVQYTPDDARRSREIANMLMGRTQGAKNWGEGFNAMMSGLVSRWHRDEADEMQQAGRAGADATRAKLVSLLGGGAGGGGFGGGNATTTSSAPLNMDGNEVYTGFMSAVREGGVTNPYALAAIAATGKHESSFRPDLATSTWSDPSESGQPGTSGGIMSWRGPRYDALTQFGGGDLSPATQAQFFLQENPELIAALNNAQSAEEAVSLMNNAWRFAGYNRRGGEAAARLATAQGFLPMFQQSPDADAYTQVASLDPTVGLDTLNAQNPATGLFDPGLATGQPAPAQAGNLPPQAPQQVAQAGNLPMQPQQQAPGSDIPVEFLMEALSSPWVDEATKAVATQLLSQQLAPPPGPEYGFMTMPDGTLVRTDKTSGGIDPLGQFASPNDSGFTLSPGQQRFDAQGNPIAGVEAQEEQTNNVRNFEYLLSQGVDPQTALERAFSGGVTVNTGDQGPRVGTIPPSMALVEDPSNPTGFRMETIPGSPAALEAEQADEMARLQSEQTGRYADVVLEDIDHALGLTGDDTTGILGTLLQNVPGTNSRNLDALLQTIRSNIGFDRLQAMRAASPTGGALGAVSDFENRQLQSTLGNLEQSQTEEQLRRNLERVRETYLDIIHGPGNRPGQEDSAPEWVNAPEPPQGWSGDPSLWQYLTPEDRALWQVR